MLCFRLWYGLLGQNPPQLAGQNPLQFLLAEGVVFLALLWHNDAKYLTRSPTKLILFPKSLLLAVTPKLSRRKFLSIPANNCVYQSECVSCKSSIMYEPIREDLLINTRCHDQVSFASGNYFVADDNGTYSSTQQGKRTDLIFCRKYFNWNT